MMTSPGAAKPFSGIRACSMPIWAHIVEVGDVVLVGKVPADGAQLGGLDVLTRGGVVQHNGDFVLVKAPWTIPPSQTL